MVRDEGGIAGTHCTGEEKEEEEGRVAIKDALQEPNTQGKKNRMKSHWRKAASPMMQRMSFSLGALGSEYEVSLVMASIWRWAVVSLTL